MRAYATVVDGEDETLSRWSKYFAAALGVTEFFLTTFGTHEQQERAASTLVKYAAVTTGRIFPAKRFSMHLRERYVRQVHAETAPDRWAFFCDLDEFPYMPLGVQSYIENAESVNCPFVIGRWVDRFADSGKLTNVDERPLEEQFPLAMRLKSVLPRLSNRGDYVFVLSKSGLRSHHPQEHAAFKPFKGLAPQVDVHHFKWHTNLGVRLRKRKEVRTRLNGYQQSVLSIIESESSFPIRAAIRVGSLLGC